LPGQVPHKAVGFGFDSGQRGTGGLRHRLPAGQGLKPGGKIGATAAQRIPRAHQGGQWGGLRTCNHQHMGETRV
jgi:hypothetical protein